MTIETIEKPEFTAIGLLVEAPFNALYQAVPAAWRDFFGRANALPAVEMASVLEISLGAPNGIYRELIGAVVPGDTPVPQGMRRLTVPANRYLRRIHDGPLMGITAGFEALLDHAAAHDLVDSGVKLDFGYSPGLPAGRHELYIGIAPFAAPRLD